MSLIYRHEAYGLVSRLIKEYLSQGVAGKELATELAVIGSAMHNAHGATGETITSLLRLMSSENKDDDAQSSSKENGVSLP